MNEERPGFSDDDATLDDPADARIRGLLASARVDSGIPADVAARLDATLADLTGRPRDGSTTQDRPVVVPLRRRSRLAPRLLAAAAVIAVAGAGAVGLGQVLDGRGSSGDADSAPSSTALDSGGTVTRQNPESAPSMSDGLAGADARVAGGPVPVLTSADFASPHRVFSTKTLTSLARAIRLADAASGESLARDQSSAPPAVGSSGDTADAKARTCPGPRIPGTRTYPIVLDRAPAVLVVHRPAAGVRLVQAWSCDGSEVLAFTTVPA